MAARQVALRSWYSGFMRNHTAAVETALDAHLAVAGIPPGTERVGAVAVAKAARLPNAQAAAAASAQAERERRVPEPPAGLAALAAAHAAAEKDGEEERKRTQAAARRQRRGDGLWAHDHAAEIETGETGGEVEAERGTRGIDDPLLLLGFLH